ncbi:PREDICTED: prostatic acid phosphatase [Dipodomys ordii]|uniref:acid phosphatase n=1 Tax=Dipodomys ordii TaxID=10020 RepID=A0A1S3G639_DIPOR|nr:PREDICTED: prostatic acid phosphatase [Dipodomys ordii]
MRSTFLGRTPTAQHPGFLLLLLSLWLHPGAVGKELKCATLVFRHGDRSPIETFPNDPIMESSWPQGFGQLTQLGMEQHYELGQYIKKRYRKLLNESYNREQVYIRSTDVDRTLMSAMTNLAALFPPEGTSIWNPTLLWQPIPVHTVSLSEDRLLYLPLRNCPRFQELESETLKSEEFQKRLHPYKDFIETLPSLSGFHGRDLFGIWSKVYDPLYCEGVHNFTLPSWATEDTMTKLKELSELSLLSLYGIHKQKEKSRLQGGVLVKEILKHLKSATQTEKYRKLVMYSAHDTTVSGLQMALDVYNGILPPYAACHLMELYLEKGFILKWKKDGNKIFAPFFFVFIEDLYGAFGCGKRLDLFHTVYVEMREAAGENRLKADCHSVLGSDCRTGNFALDTTERVKHGILRVILAIAFCLVSGVLVVLLFLLIRHGPCWQRDVYRNI